MEWVKIMNESNSYEKLSRLDEVVREKIEVSAHNMTCCVDTTILLKIGGIDNE